MTRCDIELIQAFLDGELEEAGAKELMAHLAGCPACRREFSRYKLLWLELAGPEETEVPEVLPYLRQQAITAARRQRQKAGEKRLSFWDSQKLVYKYTLAYLPGAGQFKEMTGSVIKELPGLLFSSLAGAGRRWRKNRSGRW